MDQNHNQPEKSIDESTGIRRSYECTFCKRGFTNAQALGGHMNIHRKDKAKSKSKSKHKSQEEASNKAIENHSNPRYVPPIPSADLHHQQQSFVGQQNYQLFLPSPNPSFQNENYLPVRRPDCLDAGLSLSIGKSSLPDDRDDDGEDGHSNAKENEVDLELRLGHDP